MFINIIIIVGITIIYTTNTFWISAIKHSLVSVLFYILSLSTDLKTYIFFIKLILILYFNINFVLISIFCFKLLIMFIIIIKYLNIMFFLIYWNLRFFVKFLIKFLFTSMLKKHFIFRQTLTLGLLILF